MKQAIFHGSLGVYSLISAESSQFTIIAAGMRLAFNT